MITDAESLLQKRCTRFVANEVLACVSGMVARMAQLDEELHEVWENVYSRVCGECGEQIPHDAEGEPDCESDDENYRCTNCQEWIDLDVCDSEPCEVYEHWIVTKRFGEQLKARGEVICEDFFGSVVWGRCTTGQAIMLDYGVREIVREMFADLTAAESGD